MKNLKYIFLKHPYFICYTCIYLLLQIGLIQHSGLQYAPALLFLFFIPLCLAYGLSVYLPELKFSALINTQKWAVIEWFLLLSSALIIVTHLIWLGKIPLIEAWFAENLSEANQIRKSSSASLPTWLHYSSTWIIRAILPSTILFFFIEKKKIGFIISLTLGVIYALLLMQKSLILWSLFPLVTFLILSKNWRMAVFMALTMIGLFVLSVYANNPQLHGGKHDLKVQQHSESKTNLIARGIAHRVLIVPGKTIGLWFDHVPKDKPYLYGRDFNLYAKLIEQKPIDYNLELYALFYPSYAKQGIKGSVNTAHFMRAYANFGWWGLPWAAIQLAILFWFLNNLHIKTNTALAFSLQLFPLILLGSGSLLTLLFSGGWGLIILLLTLRPNK